MKLNHKKGILLLAAAMLILVCGVGGTLAYLVTKTGPVQNTFEPAKVASKVNEPGWNDGNMTKSNVTITNTGDVSAYIRAAIVVTWQDAAGNTMPGVPVLNRDYSISINTGNGKEAWTEGTDGYYYYNSAVSAGEATSNLITSCTSNGTLNGTYTDGRRLCVEVIGSAIQSEGMGVNSAQQAFSKAAESSNS